MENGGAIPSLPDTSSWTALPLPLVRSYRMKVNNQLINVFQAAFLFSKIASFALFLLQYVICINEKL
jgi:hypothetical protein